MPSEISEYLIPHPIIPKMSLTGSTAVGKQLAAIAGAHMKRVTMELGGHAPSIAFDDADVDLASRLLSTTKLRNAGQVCVSPTLLLVQEEVYDTCPVVMRRAASTLPAETSVTHTPVCCVNKVSTDEKAAVRLPA